LGLYLRQGEGRNEVLNAGIFFGRWMTKMCLIGFVARVDEGASRSVMSSDAPTSSPVRTTNELSARSFEAHHSKIDIVHLFASLVGFHA
jgi:hypothetical protein